MAVQVESLSLPEPKALHLDYLNWRDGQIEGLEWLTSADWLSNDTLDKDARDEVRQIRVLEAPTGTGKTGLILALAGINPKLRFLVLCATKIEQDQYIKNLSESMPWGDVVSVRGKNNHHCVYKHPELRSNGDQPVHICIETWCQYTHVDEAPCEGAKFSGGGTDDVSDEKFPLEEVERMMDGSDDEPSESEIKRRFKCPVKGFCTYYTDIAQARNARVVITNYAYGLSILNFTDEGFGEIDVIVEDEGHVLDQQLENFISVKLSKNAVGDLFSLMLPDFQDGGTVTQWVGWLNDHEADFETAVETWRGLDDDELTPSQLRDKIRTFKYLKLFNQIKDLNYEWIVEKVDNGVEFKPVWVTEESESVLFDHSLRHVIMSGTIPSAKELGAKVGLDQKDFQFKRLPYTFLPENRLIIVRPVVNLGVKVIDQNLSVMVQGVDDIIREFEGWAKKVLIHSKSYKITRHIIDNSEYQDIMMTHDSRNRAAQLDLFKQSALPMIMVSPSFDKAVDLPGEECELIIIVKVPYGYLGSKVMAERARQSRRYYAHETLMTLIQMAGRGVRSDQDVCPTVIVDAAGPRFLKQVITMGLLPDGIKAAVRLQVFNEQTQQWATAGEKRVVR